MYLDDPEPLVDSLCELAAPAGVVSIVAKNLEDLVLEAELLASQRDPYRRLSRLFHLIGRRPA